MLRGLLQRPIAVSMLFAALLLIGLLSYRRLPVDLLPSIIYPRLTVLTTYADIPAEDLERLVTQPLEEVVTALSGVRGVNSRTREGISTITVEYEWGSQMDFANLHLREAVDRVAFRDDFPDAAERPVILRWDPTSRPISILVLDSTDRIESLTEFAREVVKPAMEQVDGVSQAEVVGGADREIRVEPDSRKLAIYGIDLEDLRQALARSNISFPGGKVKQGPLHLSLRIDGEFESLEEIAATDITRVGQSPIRIGDVARVLDTVKEPEGMTLLGETPVVSMLIYKEPEANTLKVSAAVDEALAVVSEDYADFAYSFVYRDAEYVKASFLGLRQSLIVGGGLAIFVLFFFLRDLRSPLVVGLAIPISIVITFGALYFGGVKLNLMSLGGLSLAAGMLVDNSIVVLENINRHLAERRKRGDDEVPGEPDDGNPLSAAIAARRRVAAAAASGTREVARPVIAATLTTIAVFFPVVYVSGIAGAFFRDQALTVTFSLLVSIGAALLLQPVLSTWILRVDPRPPRGLFRLFQLLFDRLHHVYHRLLVTALRHPAPLLLLALVGIVGAGFWGTRLDRSFMPQRSLGDLKVEVELPAGTPLAETVATMSNLGGWIEEQEGVRAVFSQVGRTERTLAAMQDYTAPNTARVRVILEPQRGAYARGRELQRAIEGRLARVSEAAFTFRDEGIGLGEILGAGGAEFNLGVLAEDPREAVDAAERLLVLLESVDGLRDLQVDRVLGTPNVVVRLDREEILRNGLDPDRMARELQARIAGVEATQFNEIDQRVDIAVRFSRDFRIDLNHALAAPVRLANGQTVPLRSFLILSEERPVRELVRRNQRRMVNINGDVSGRSLDDVWSEAQEVVRSAGLSADIRVVQGGERQEMVRSFRELGMAMLLAAVLVYMILAAQFESFLDPLLIAAVIPIGLAGAIVALGVTGGSVNILSLIGVLALLGIAVNDAIVKVDTMRRLRDEGLPGHEAILTASRLRLRPILMTSVTTVLAMIPMAIGLGSGEQLQRPLAITIIGGLSLTTLLTLYVTPTLYQIAHRIRRPEAGGMTRLFVRHPVSTWMLFTVFAVLAVYAVPRIEIEALPEVDLPSLTVMTRWNGASPKAVQRSITLPIEEAVRRVHGVESVISTSRASQSTVQVEFTRDTDIDFARLYVNEQLGSVRRDLPLNASQPQIIAFVPEDFQTEEFFTFAVESDLSPNALRELAESWVVPQVLAVEGVADAQVRGGARPLLKILLDRNRLDMYEVSADEIFASIDQLDELTGAGVVRSDGTERLVALRHPVDIERIERAVVARRGARTFQLRTLGTVLPDFEDPTYFVRSDGRNVVQVQVEKRSGSNSVSVSRALRAAIPEIEAASPAGIRLVPDEDEGKELEGKLKELVARSVVILFLLFVLLVVSLRQVQLTAITIASVMFALVICLSLFYFLDLSVNFITISGLTICFGLLLDNSILVLDSIYRRLEGMRRADAAGLSRASKLRVARETVVAGTREVMFPILATTLTTVVAFLSFIFLSGRLALYYVPLAISVGTAMFASVFVAFGWIPVVLNQTWAARLVRRSEDGAVELEDHAAVEAMVADVPDLETRPGWRQSLLIFIQKWLWWLVVPATAGLMVWGSFVYDDKVVKGGFWRMPDDEQLFLFMRMPDGTDVQVASETLLKFEEALLPLHEGADMNATVFGNQALLTVEFDDALLHSGIPALYRGLLTEVADATGGTAIFLRGFADQPYFKGNLRGSSGNSLLKVSGYNSKQLNELAEGALARAQTNRRVRKGRITGTQGFGQSNTEETVVTLRRDALADHGLTVLEVIGFMRRLLGVDTPWNMLIDGEQEQVQLSFLDAETIEYSDVAEQTIENAQGERVRLSDLVQMETVPLSDAIVRENQRYTMFVNWEYVGTNRMRSDFIKRTLGSLDLPYGYSAEESEQEFLTQQEESDLQLTIILAAVFILMIMAALFESLWLPLLVLTSVPMALFGVVMIYWQTSTAFDSSARIGLVLLFGVVVNNAILLVSRFRTECALVLKAKLGGNPSADAALFNDQRKALGGQHLWHLPAKERPALLRRAIARGTVIKLRPILLTSGTSIVGLIPLLVQLEWLPSKIPLIGNEIPFTLSWMNAENQDIWQNLALTSIGGLLSSTILILLALPPMYYMCVRAGWIGRRFWNAARRLFVRRSPAAQQA